ncbi:MAG: transporter [Candidatus Tectomicrobia bacterium]|uniref:Transporter n=1 Tax=Tectimicrobiota bacterium TaxID=2528274 RepID=A0A932CRD0_UNCTE|nr:transporter [Candidatus Tectomicrobia bacterium]
MKTWIAITLFVSLSVLPFPRPATAHHGGVSLSRGPGSPIETNSPLTLPQGGLLPLVRTEYVAFREFRFAEPQNKDAFLFSSFGLAYGVRPYLTVSLFLPYNLKQQDTLGSPQGIGDLKFLANLGFHHDPEQGWGWNGAEDTAIALEETRKTYLSLFGGLSLPTGKSRERLGGEIDRGMQPGFRSPTFTLGAAATRQVADALSLVGDASYDLFTQKDRFKFGDEWRFDLATIYELYGDPQRTVSKIDGVLELNLLKIGRDEERGRGLRATGGTILYLSPGIRFSISNANLGLLLKIPVFKNLKEEDEQQGAEGLEAIRAIVTISFAF